MGIGICCTAVGYKRRKVYSFKFNFKQVCLHYISVVSYLRQPRLKALLLCQRGRSQSRVGGTEEVTRVHIEGWDLSCRTWMHH